ncbi:MAG: PSD1 domain-containing protein, partial [Verrucomicrobia bacterium]|nr:PSD1 domain-containing protein [Verrucomicrobiota bacterium]
FRLDEKSSALKAGEKGFRIVPGRSAESPLIRYVAGLVPDMMMPAKGDLLTRDQIGLLRAWIDQGAVWPETAAVAKAKSKADHWAFQVPPRPAVPAIAKARGLWNPIDYFIRAKLKTEELTPSPEADRVTLIRRLTFDLHGLPPSPAEVRAFVNDRRSDAYERLVDQLLASPRYGERWGRHWLDVVHFGESHGYDKDKPRPNAWPYRDYVIRALNEDKPYSRFVQEQLAGDILFPNEPQGVVATGFIAAGPWDFVGHAELPITKTDGLIARYNDRDDMVMTAMSTFMSLTVHCARCHDHKFDPIAQRDYYSLQAVFAGVDRANRPFDNDKKVFAQRMPLLAEKRVLDARLKTVKDTIAKITSLEIEQADTQLKEQKEQLAKLPKPAKESPSNGYHSAIESTPDVTKWVQVDLVQPLALGEIRLVPARPTDFADTPGFGFPKRFRIEACDEDSFKKPTLLVDHTDADFPNPSDTPFVLPVKNVRARFVRVTATRLWERTHDFVFALAELQIMSGTNNVAKWSVASAFDSIEAGRWGKAKLVDGYDSRKALEEITETADARTKRESLEGAKKRNEEKRATLVESLLDANTKTERGEVTNHLASVKQKLDALPKPELVYAAASDFEPMGSFQPAEKPRPVHLLRRGDVKSKGDLVSAGAVNCLKGLPGEFSIANADDEGARRAALAKWITDSRNLLMRRSIVNRVWQYHFGRGIVDSPNDFGHMGALPTHPELLDWLAGWFQDHGESFKQLHRLIVTSATYRQTSNGDAARDRLDGDNRYLWRMNRQRLDAESFRDALLAINGRLDLTMGGPSVQQFFFKDDHSPVYDYTRFDVESAGANRRSVYRFIVRSVPDPFMECMDSADPSLLTPKRNATLTALQALSSLNNPFVVKQVEHFAECVQKAGATLPKQIAAAYELALNRRPTHDESKVLVDYARQHGLPNACRVILNSNEFMFVD